MKTKMAVLLGVALLTVISLASPYSCVTGIKTEIDYREVAVSTMKLTIPTEWQRPADWAELMEDYYSTCSAEELQSIYADAYTDESEDAYLFIVIVDLVGLSSSEGWTWRGWDIELEELGLTPEEFAESLQPSLMEDYAELNRETYRPLMVGGNQTWEMMYTAKYDGEPVKVCVLLIFTPDGVGELSLKVTQNEWTEFEETWDKIRDSVTFSYQQQPESASSPQVTPGDMQTMTPE